MKKIICLLLTVLMFCVNIPQITDCTLVFAAEGTEVVNNTDGFNIKLELSGVSSDAVSPMMPEGTIYYAACGDSITHANHALVDDIDTDDPYYPIDGYSGTTYARKNYAYYIAQNNDFRWANYGYGGTTLHHCYPKGYGGTSMRTYPFVDDRITQLQEGVEWDYISLFFGYNDVIYGPVQQRDIWLTETYGEELGYPVKDSQIGTEGFANAEQKAACDAVTGFVGGVEYTDNTEYFFAKFMGTVDDTETTTFLGAYNYALDYLTTKYPDAKILIINSYVSGTNNTRKIFRDGVNAIAEKWGVSCMDFSDLSYWFYGVDQKRVEFPNPHREDGRWVQGNGKGTFAGTVEGYNRARFTTDGTHPSNLGYQTISKPIERALIDFSDTVNVSQGNPFETEFVLDDVYTDMNISVTMGGTDITDQCYADGKVSIDSVTGNVIIRAEGYITYTDGHTYLADITAPTCTEQGYTTYTCECGKSYVADYVDAVGHKYINGICSGCGNEHPNLENYEGKVISILGASVDTFEGYIPVADGFNLEHRTRYPDTSRIPDVIDVNQTWWMQVINELDAKLGINDSWAGSTVYWGENMSRKNSDTGEKAAMASITRIQNLGANGTPDLILFNGGGNDKAKNVTVGIFDSENVPEEVDLVSTEWDTFADAYTAAIMRIKYYYPDAEIIALTKIMDKESDYVRTMKEICEYFDIPFVILLEHGLEQEMLPDGSHPNCEGMDVITAAVINTLMEKGNLSAGENKVYPITHNLTGAEAEKHYYKGVSAGAKFEETVTGEELSVMVTMGGKDVTAEVYKDGKISISAVTGEIVVTAKAKYDCDGHLQQLPEELCAGTNLWTALEPENIYYKATGWGNNSEGTSWSITFPVEEGERVYASSFRSSEESGGSGNGTRITWFSETGVLESVARENVYAEYLANGYVVVPEGAVAVNIPISPLNPQKEVYLLDRKHNYKNGICTVCGKWEFSLADLNRDGFVDVKDVYTARLVAAKLLSPTEEQIALGDVDSDGKITAIDANIIRKYAVGIIKELPVS